MKQQLKMIGHFVVWCLTGIFNNVKNFFMSFLRIREMTVGYVKSICDEFRRSFALGLLGYMLSSMITVGFCLFISALVDTPAETLRDLTTNTLATLRIALGFNTVLYFSCYAYVLYERFLEDYSKTWNILKDKE